MTRDEHLTRAKERALVYLDAGDLANAVASMGSDLEDHPELGVNEFLMAAALIHVISGDKGAVRRWVEGFR